jgi:hypothetical protein
MLRKIHILLIFISPAIFGQGLTHLQFDTLVEVNGNNLVLLTSNGHYGSYFRLGSEQDLFFGVFSDSPATRSRLGKLIGKWTSDRDSIKFSTIKPTSLDQSILKSSDCKLIKFSLSSKDVEISKKKGRRDTLNILTQIYVLADNLTFQSEDQFSGLNEIFEQETALESTGVDRFSLHFNLVDAFKWFFYKQNLYCGVTTIVNGKIIDR